MEKVKLTSKQVEMMSEAESEGKYFIFGAGDMASSQALERKGLIVWVEYIHNRSWTLTNAGKQVLQAYK